MTIIERFIDVKKYVTGNGYVMLLHIAGTCAVVYLICWLAQICYDAAAKPISRLITRYFKIDLTLRVD